MAYVLFSGQESPSRSQILTGMKLCYATKWWCSLEDNNLNQITIDFWNVTDYLGSMQNKQAPAPKYLQPNGVFTALFIHKSGTFPW